MSFLWFNKSKSLFLEDKRLLLRPLQKNDYLQWEQVRSSSKEFLTPFEPRWRDDDLSVGMFLRRLEYNKRQIAKRREFSFSIWLKSKEKQILAGGLTLSNIRFSSGHVNLGYWIAEKEKNKGIMSAAVALTLPFVFNTLGLRRIHAATLPYNLPSRRLLEKNGFVEEGFAKNYLQIDGAWRDHVLYALTLQEYKNGKI